MGASPISSAIGGIIFGYIADRTDMRKVVFLGSYLAYAVTPVLITVPQPIYQCKEPSRINMKSKFEAIHYQYVSIHKIISLGKPESPNTINDYEKKLFVIELVITVGEPRPSERLRKSLLESSLRKLSASSRLVVGRILAAIGTGTSIASPPF